MTPGSSRWSYAALVLCAFLATGTISALAADERDWTFEVSLYPEYSEGTYGTKHRTQILYAPLVVGWSPTERLDLHLTVPFLWERGHDILALVGGDGARSAQKVDTRRRSRAGIVEEQGFGDVLLEAEYIILEDRGALPEIAPFLEIKFPTADAGAGLGTGAFDETLGVSLTKAVGSRWTGYLEAWYVFVGSPRHVRLDDSFGWLVGIGYDVTRSFKATAYVEGATSVSTHGDDPLDVRFEAEYRLARRLTLLAGVTAGLTSAAPHYAVSVGLRRRF